jgi:hypothetical protein
MSAVATTNGAGTQLEPSTPRAESAAAEAATTASSGTHELSYLGAISEALREEMRRDESVFCLGEDIG